MVEATFRSLTGGCFFFEGKGKSVKGKSGNF